MARRGLLGRGALALRGCLPRNRRTPFADPENMTRNFPTLLAAPLLLVSGAGCATFDPALPPADADTGTGAAVDTADSSDTSDTSFDTIDSRFDENETESGSDALTTDANADGETSDTSDGACADLSTRCTGRHLETCHAGTWDDSGECPVVCDENRCREVAEIKAGAGHLCARMTNGAVYCWGNNEHGQLGIGSTAYQTVPIKVVLPRATSLSLGVHHTCARVDSGEAYCWGWNQWGEVGDGTKVQRELPTLAKATGFSTISAGYYNTLANGSGGLFGWGLNSSCAVSADGDCSLHLTPAAITAVTDVKAFGLGWFHACAITNAGKLLCWGSGRGLGTGEATAERPTPFELTGLPKAVSINTVRDTNCAVFEDATVRCWGAGPLGDGTSEVATTPRVIVNLAGTTRIGLGDGSSCALFAGGKVRCWGKNDMGQMGNDTSSTTPVLEPVESSLKEFAVEVASTGNTVCAVARGTVYCWGAGGALGNGSLIPSRVPVAVKW
jgi:alpha-tubulin suppressor-like RCC1 family protein